MRVLVDLRTTQGRHVSADGGSEYARSVVRRIAELDRRDRFVALVEHGLGDSDVASEARTRGIEVVVARSDAEIVRYSAELELTAAYCPLPYGLQAKPGKLPTIVTIHGLRPIELPTDSQEWRYTNLIRLPIVFAKGALRNHYVRRRMQEFRALINLTDLIVAPSEHTKAALCALFPGAVDKLTPVLYSPRTAVTQSETPDAQLLAEIDLEDSAYVLLVSGGRYEKNILRALSAIRMLRNEGSWPGLRVVITGGVPRFTPPALLEGVSVLPYVNRQCLGALYCFARALIYPTLNEGFGYPPVEAMRFGTPVAAAGVCSLPEIYGDAISYFDPRNEHDIAAKIWRVLHHPPSQQVTRKKADAILSRQDADLDKLINLLCDDRLFD